jgi:hypothetical protein
MTAAAAATAAMGGGGGVIKVFFGAATAVCAMEGRPGRTGNCAVRGGSDGLM